MREQSKEDRKLSSPPPPPPLQEQEEDDEEAIHGDTTTNTTSPPRAEPRLSEMAKDPLDIGVSLPVLVRAPPRPPLSSVARIPSTSVSGLEAAEGEGSDLAVGGREVIDMVNGGGKKGPKTAVGVPVTGADCALQDVVPADVNAQLALLDASIKNMANNSSREAAHNDDAMAMRWSLEEQTSMPGGYAIAGPGIDADANTYAEGFAATITAAVTDAFGNIRADRQDPILERSGSICLATTGEATTVQSSHNSSHLNVSSDYLVEATLVTDQQEDGNAVVHAEAKPLQRFPSSLRLALALLVLGLVVVVAVAVSVLQGRGGSSSADDGAAPQAAVDPTGPVLPTLQRIRETGVVRCGTMPEFSNFFAQIESTHEASNLVDSVTNDKSPRLSNSFSKNFCATVAAAVFGDNGKYEIVVVSEETKPQRLGNREIDFMLSRHSMTMQQDVYEEGAGEGLAYSIPYLYSGVGFTGIPHYVECADDSIMTFNNCSDLKICIDQKSQFVNELLVRIPHRQMLVANSTGSLFTGFITGNCNVIVTENPSLAATIVTAMGYSGALAVGKRDYTPEMYTVISLDSDPIWRDFLNALTMALLAAEQAGITKDTAERIGETTLFGEEYRFMFIDAIKTGGNFGNIYDFPVPRDGRNRVNNGTTGMLISPPLGGLERIYPEPPGPVAGGTLEAVLVRGMLHCGIRGGRPGFAMYNPDQTRWEGFEIDFCRSLAASLFDGEADQVLFMDVSSRSSGGFVMLRTLEVDVFAGAMWTLENDMRESTTKFGYSFSEPYFYAPSNDTSFEENLCLATRQEDPQWASFVYWTSQSIVYAEEHGIVQRASSQMPLVYFFGAGLLRIFRDAVHAVGNYGELYEHHLETILPRGGRNRLNLLEDQGRGPLRYLPPGFPI